MSFPMLPKIDRENQRFVNRNAGEWTRETSGDYLTSLVNSLAAGAALEDINNIDSIPDIWARPLLFEMALFDFNDAGNVREFVAGLHDKVVGEWRAILAMLALKNIRHLNIKAVSVNLDAEENKSNELAQIFSSLIPKESFNGNENAWSTDIYVLFYKGKPFAMTSPVTLVASAADYVEIFYDEPPAPWLDKNTKILIDPIERLSGDELFALNFWLENLYSELQKMSRNVSGGAKEIATKLLTCIENYQRDIGVKIKNKQMPALNLVASNLNLHIGTARFLDNTVQERAATIADSAVRLLTNPKRKKKNLIMVSPEMARSFAEQEDIDASQLIIWQGVSAEDITEQTLQGERNKIGEIILKDAEYRRPEDFFYGKMAVIEPGKSFPGAAEISGAEVITNFDLDIILPIKRELLEIFSPEEIMSRVSVSADSDNDISVHFNFPLSSGEYRFTKNYRGENLIYIQKDIPVIEIYPNIRRAGWNKYYLYYENYQAQAKENPDSLVKEMLYIEPWSFGKQLTEEFPAQGLKNRLTTKLNDFPECLICNYKVGEMAVEIGALILNKPQNVKRQIGLDWKIGVDFGTSSTMIYFAQDKQPPKPLDFDSHLLQITESRGARANTFLSFISSSQPARLDGSFLSIFHLIQRNDSDKIRPLIDGHVLSFISPRIFEEFGNSVDTNLKWQNDDFGRMKVAAYIEQICLQSLVEAVVNGVDRIQWNFSYPTAFSQDQTLAFDAASRDAVKSAYENTGNPIAEIETWTESKASAYYFNKLNDGISNFNQGALCIDIGAGTTDITVISGQPGRIVYHTSVQYAGRYMFQPIYDNYELFAALDTKIQTLTKEQRQALIDADMRQNSDEYISNLAFKTGLQEVKEVLQCAQLAVAGLFYYIGEIVGALYEAEIYTHKNIPYVYIGGNGSRIFRWITGGSEIENNPYLKVFEKMLVDASGLKRLKNFQFNLSHYPKVEVASGMIIEPPSNASEFFDQARINDELFGEDSDDYVFNSILAGAEFTQGTNTFTADAFISANDVSEGINVATFDSFRKFMSDFNAAKNLWADGVDFDEESAEEIIRDTNSFYVASVGADVKKIFLEPVFIIELKRLMEMF